MPNLFQHKDFETLRKEVAENNNLLRQLLKKLDDATIIAKEPLASKRKKSVNKEMKEELKKMGLVIRQAGSLQRQFNLKVPPHQDRVIQYLATKDPKVFDGLKRND